MKLQIGSNISSRAKAQSSLEKINAVKINNLLHCYFHLHSVKLQMESNISSRVKAHSSVEQISGLRNKKKLLVYHLLLRYFDTFGFQFNIIVLAFELLHEENKHLFFE